LKPGLDLYQSKQEAKLIWMVLVVFFSQFFLFFFFFIFPYFYVSDRCCKGRSQTIGKLVTCLSCFFSKRNYIRFPDGVQLDRTPTLLAFQCVHSINQNGVQHNELHSTNQKWSAEAYSSQQILACD
jgi:hypothetical protein